MGCPSSCVLGDNLVFSVTTHEPTTGVLTDADAAPAYRVYEDETETAVLSGTMAKLDDGNTTGFYSEQLAVTAANGFEAGKTYTIYVTAAVGGDTGGISFAFKAEHLVAGVTVPEALRRIGVITSGLISGAGTGVETFVDWDSSVHTVVVTVDDDGNRSQVVFN